MKIIIGAGITTFDGWTSTQETELNLLNRADFERMFKTEKPTAFLAEHVWEHMTLEDGIIAAQNCFDFLNDSGYIRVAVPDKNFRNEWYQNMVKVGGNGDPNHPALRIKLFMIINSFVWFLKKLDSRWNSLNTVTKTDTFTTSTGTKLTVR